MGKSGRKRSVPVPVAWRPVKSQRRARQITSVFHQLTHAKENATQQSSADRPEAGVGAERQPDAIDEDVEQDGSEGGSNSETQLLAQKLKQLGGRRVYQAASALATARNTSSAKWIFKSLTALGKRPAGKKRAKKHAAHSNATKVLHSDSIHSGEGGPEQSNKTTQPLVKSGQVPAPKSAEESVQQPETRKPQLLEIGAVNTQLLACQWLDVTPIDLRSQHPKIHQVDFLRFGDPVTTGPCVFLELSSLFLFLLITRRRISRFFPYSSLGVCQCVP